MSSTRAPERVRARAPAWGRMDLHCHSDASDGRFPPEEVLERAARGKVDVLALTDHDLPPALAAGVHSVGERRVRVIHATELSGVHEGREQHLLVYFPGEMPESFVRFLRGRAAARAERYDESIRRLGCVPGGELPAADEDARAGRRAITRHHLARALKDSGMVPDMRTAFSRLAPLVPRIELPFLEAIRVAQEAGGLTSWAHPDREDAQAWTKSFVAAGLQGLEGARPQQDRSTRNALKALAERHGLLVTGGSDWHGWHEGELGRYTIEGDRAQRFAERLGLPPLGEA